MSAEQLDALERHLRPWERALGRAAMGLARGAARVLPARLSSGFHAAFHHFALGQFIAWNPPKLRGGYATLLDVFEHPPAAPPPAARTLRQRLRRTAV
jgi:hypothetical protein